jgi:amidase
MHNDLPASVSLVARNGADEFLLHLVESIYDNIEK